MQGNFSRCASGIRQGREASVLRKMGMLPGWLMSAVALVLCATSTCPVGVVQAETVNLAQLYPPYTESIWIAVEAAAQLAVHHVNTRNLSIAGPVGPKTAIVTCMHLQLLRSESWDPADGSRLFALPEQYGAPRTKIEMLASDRDCKA